MQLILELLVARVPPTAIPKSVDIFYQSLYGMGPETLPSVSFIRESRAILQVLLEMSAGLKLAKADKWDHMFNDATSRGHRHFSALVVGVMGENMEIEPITVSSSILIWNESSESQAEALLDKVSELNC